MATTTRKGTSSQSRGAGIRSKSTTNANPKQHARTQKVKSSPIYHATSEKELTKGLQKLSIHNNNRLKSGSTNSIRRYDSAGKKPHQCLEVIARDILEQRIKNVVVMAGAGISTSSGIPDFRTPGTGLYDNLQQYKIPYPQAIFDIDYFERNPRPFFTLAKELYPNGKYRPNYVHYFMKLLEEKGLLHKVYTQNIDGLERMAGVTPAKLVEAHGNFSSASCTKCHSSQNTEDIKKVIFENKLPRCKRKECFGLVKPDIVFFGEDLPRKFYYYLRDFPQADLLLVMGTSLEVEPFAGIVDAVRLYVPRVLFNRVAVGPFSKKRRMNDFVITGDMVEGVEKLVAALGWEQDLKDLIINAEGSFKQAWVSKKETIPSQPTNKPAEKDSVQDSSSESASEVSKNGQQTSSKQVPQSSIVPITRERHLTSLHKPPKTPVSQENQHTEKHGPSNQVKWATRSNNRLLHEGSKTSSQKSVSDHNSSQSQNHVPKTTATPVTKPPVHPVLPSRRNLRPDLSSYSNSRFRHDSPLGEHSSHGNMGKDPRNVDFRHRITQILSTPSGRLPRTKVESDSDTDSDSTSSSDED